jgi:hypothetical protein
MFLGDAGVCLGVCIYIYMCVHACVCVGDIVLFWVPQKQGSEMKLHVKVIC